VAGSSELPVLANVRRASIVVHAEVPVLEVETDDVPVRILIHVSHGSAPNMLSLVRGIAPLSGSKGSVVGGSRSTAVVVRAGPEGRGLIGCWKLCVEILHDDLRKESG
jgi:hypothetical protein